MMLIGTEASFRKANEAQADGPATTTVDSNKLTKSSAGPDEQVVPMIPSRNEGEKETASVGDGPRVVVKPPLGYFVPPFHPPTHHAAAMALPPIPAYHPHGYAMMVPTGVPFHPQHHSQQHPVVAHHPQAYSYARRTALPEPKKLYDQNESQETETECKVDDRKNGNEVSTRKPPVNALDGASLLLEAARVQQERQDRQQAAAATEKEIKKRSASPYTTTSSSANAVPSLVSEEQENQQKGYTFAPSHPPMVVPYHHHHPYRHPYLPPPPPPGHPSYHHKNMQLQKNVGNVGPKRGSNKTKAKHPRRGPWTEKEDAILRSAVAKMGAHRWSRIAENLPGREGKHCRNRWYHHLSPHVNKKSWTLQEDYIILQLHQAYGNRWSVIARQLEGRTDNAVKNRFNASMRSKIEGYLVCSRGCPVTQDDQGKYLYGDDLEGCLWAIRGPPNSEAAFRVTLGTKRLTNSYFRSVREWSEKWKRENAAQIFEYKKALKIAPTSFDQHHLQQPSLLQPIHLSFNKNTE